MSSRMAFLPPVQHPFLDPEPESGYALSIYDDPLAMAPHCWASFSDGTPTELDCSPLSLSSCLAPEDFLTSGSSWSPAGSYLRLVSSSPSLDSDFSTSPSTPSPPPSFRHSHDTSDNISSYFNFELGFTDGLSPIHCMDTATLHPHENSQRPIAAAFLSDYHPGPLAMSSALVPHQSNSRETSPSSSDGCHQKRRFPCGIPGCARRFTSQYTLKVHMEAHKPKPKVSFPCTEGCSERFSRQHDRLRHEVAKHGKVCEFSCDDCGRFFSTKKTLGNHKCPVAQGSTRWVTN
jgi:hypothetical protein